MFLLLVAHLSELLGAAVEYPELLLDGVFLLKGTGELGPPEGLHLFEGLDHLSVLSYALVPTGLLQLKLQLGIHLEVADEVCSCLADLYSCLLGFLRQKFVVKSRHLAVWTDIVLLETLFKVCVLVHKWANCRSKDVH